MMFVLKKQGGILLDIKEELKVLFNFIKRGIIINVMDIDLVQEEKGEIILFKAKVRSDVNGIPMFQDTIFKMTKTSIRQLIQKTDRLVNPED